MRFVELNADARLTVPTFLGWDGLAAPLADPPTVSIESATGRTLDQPAVDATEYHATLTAASHTNTADLLTVAWAGATTDGRAQTITETVEIGTAWFDLAALQAAPQLRKDTFSADQLRGVRDVVCSAIDTETDINWVPRLHIIEQALTYSSLPLLSGILRPRRVLTASIDGVTLADDLDGYVIGAGGTIARPASAAWPAWSKVRLVIEAGHDQPPADLRAAAIEWATHLLHQGFSGIHPMATSFSTGEVGSQAVQLPQPTWPTGYRTIDPVIRRHKQMRQVVA